MQSPILRNIPEQFDTERLRIRCPRPGDGPIVHEAVAETIDDLRAWVASVPWAAEEPSPQASETFCREGFAAYMAHRDFPLLLFQRDSGVLVGSSGLHRVDWKVPKVEIGYWCRRSFQGQGLITEAVRALGDFAIAHLEARRIEIRCDALNHKARAVCDRAGYQLEGILRHAVATPDGGLRDVCVYALIP